MKVTEIFASIQGESTLQGLPCVFVRLTGCNLSCRYCDTPYALEGGEDISASGVIERVRGFRIGYVCITGGEPLLHPETPELARGLLSLGFRVSVETNGSLDAGSLPEGVVRVIDIKCPGSGHEGCVHASNLSRRRSGDEFKFVLTGREDFTYARDFAREHHLAYENTVLLSPVRNLLDPALLVEWIILEMPEARLNLQLHRCIWPSEIRGR
jgi:7-carboxy-7-deazaguanine synthase